MAELYGRDWTRQELLAHAGDVAQLGGVQLVTMADGPERGVRAALFRTGEGFNFTVLLDRGMDIGPAEYRGVPLAWVSPTGPAAPAFYDPRGLGWLRTFHGGLLTTCGLTQVGVPNVDGDEELGLHGRISHIPAHLVAYGGVWQGDEYVFSIEGRVREASVFGHDLQLTRRISARLGQPGLTIEDCVENLGSRPAPHMILYHINLGFPLLGPEARLDAPSVQVLPRDAAAVPGLAQHSVFQPPTPGYAEQCFFHTMAPADDGTVSVRLVNESLGLALQLRYRRHELGEFTQWKQVGQGEYVLGLEPGNCRPEGRSSACQRGVLVEMQPGERVCYGLDISILPA